MKLVVITILCLVLIPIGCGGRSKLSGLSQFENPYSDEALEQLDKTASTPNVDPLERQGLNNLAAASKYLPEDDPEMEGVSDEFEEAAGLPPGVQRTMAIKKATQACFELVSRHRPRPLQTLVGRWRLKGSCKREGGANAKVEKTFRVEEVEKELPPQSQSRLAASRRAAGPPLQSKFVTSGGLKNGTVTAGSNGRGKVKGPNGWEGEISDRSWDGEFTRTDGDKKCKAKASLIESESNVPHQIAEGWKTMTSCLEKVAAIWGPLAFLFEKMDPKLAAFLQGEILGTK